MSAIRCVVRDDRRGVNLSLSAESGERIALVGPNGAGKSTVLEAVAGLLRGGSAHVDLSVNGCDMRKVPVYQRSAVLLSQQSALFEHMNVRANVEYGPRSRGLSRSDARSFANAILEDVGISHLARRTPGTLSGGQAQKVSLARAIAADPQVLLLDEPLAALDVNAAEDMRVLVARTVERRTVVFATHDVLDIGAWATRVVHIDGGNVVWDGPALDLFARPANDFLASLTGRAWVSGTRVQGEDSFLSDGGVRLPVAPAPITGRVRALIDPAALRVTAGGARSTDVPERARMSRIGTTPVMWIFDVPVRYVPGAGGTAGDLPPGGVTVEATSPVYIEPAGG